MAATRVALAVEAMPFLLRVELPDVPGRWAGWRPRSVRPAATSRRSRSSRSATTAPRSTTSCSRWRTARCPTRSSRRATRSTGVQVLWINRYAAGGNLFLDLEAVEDLTAHPATPSTGWSTCCRSSSASDWGARVHRTLRDRARHRGGARRPGLHRARRAGPGRRAGRRRPALAARPLDADEIVLIGRRGGPEFLDSELARLGHLAGLARIDRRADRAAPDARRHRRARAGRAGSAGRSSSGTRRTSARCRPPAATTRRAPAPSSSSRDVYVCFSAPSCRSTSGWATEVVGPDRVVGAPPFDATAR